MGNILELKTVNELCEYSFFIPAYQRGFRWTEQEVIELLNDIDEFVPKQIDNSAERTWYCLQPIVLKSRNHSEYEVIDGQQRLTTIFLLLHYLNQDFVETRRDKLFSIDYQTRKNNPQFMNGLGTDTKEVDNIDFFYIHNAYITIEKWFDDKKNFNKDDFRSKFKFNTKVIWYQSFEEDSIAVFTRLNIGKISLSNAELIKALFLNSSNFNVDEDRIRNYQIEIASNWDNMENKLQDDRFWCFINNDPKHKSNRIEFIFDLMNLEENIEDNYSTFRYFSKILDTNSPDGIRESWRDVESYYLRFLEWFNERELYHKIGYLLATSEKNMIEKLYNKSKELTKKEFAKYLDQQIKTSMNGIKFSELYYGTSSENKDIKKVLLLYNILTILRNEQDNSYFPFELYKNNKKGWDVEHIASIKEEIPNTEKTIEGWLKVNGKPWVHSLIIQTMQ